MTYWKWELNTRTGPNIDDSFGVGVNWGEDIAAKREFEHQMQFVQSLSLRRVLGSR